MKKLFLFLIPLMFISCNSFFDQPDNEFTFPVVDVSSFIQNDRYYIPKDATALQVFNLFYSVYGYGYKTINGIANNVDGNSCNITSVNVYHLKEGQNESAFYVALTNGNNETITYCYKWQFKIYNAWVNNKAGNWNNNLDWNITIYK